MGRPAIRLFPLPPLFLGREHVLEFELTPEEPIKIDYLEARITGRQGWEVGSGKSKVSHRVLYPQLAQRFLDRGVLPAGPQRFTMRFALPHDMAPSHDRSPAEASLELRIRVAIPWWFDIKYDYVLQARKEPPASLVRTPIAMRSTPITVAADKPRIEIALPSTRLIAGEAVTGSIAVFHLDDAKPRQVELSLFPQLSLMGRGRVRERAGRTLGVGPWELGGATAVVELPAGSAGTSVPFTLVLPPDLTPSFQSITQALAWRLYARTGSFFGGKVDITLPLEIYDPVASATTPALREAPRLADERIGAVFARFAGFRGWEGHRLDPAEDDVGRIAIERELPHATQRITYAYRDDGTFLISRLAYRSLGLGLSVTPSSSLRHVFWKDIEVDIAAWDKAHLVHARFEAQAVPPLKAAVTILARLGELGTMTSWTDDAILWERPISNLEEHELETSARLLDAAATAISACRPTITSPPGLAVELAAWRELATSLGAELSPGDLSIEGKLGHVPVIAGLEFDTEHRPTDFAVTAGDPEDASAAARAVKLHLTRPASDVLGANVAEALVDPLTRWPADFIELDIADGVASAKWRLANGAPVEAARAKQLIHAVVAVLAAIDPGAGPYR